MLGEQSFAQLRTGFRSSLTYGISPDAHQHKVTCLHSISPQEEKQSCEERVWCFPLGTIQAGPLDKTSRTIRQDLPSVREPPGSHPGDVLTANKG